MFAVLDARSSQSAAAEIEWLPVIAGVLVLYVPTFYGLATGLWREADYAHGPIILGIILWLMWKERGALRAATAPEEPPIESRLVIPARAFPAAPAPGFALLVFGLLLYAVGRSQDIALFEVGSLGPVLAGILLAMRGWPGLRAFWFPILFVVFIVPLPGSFVDALSSPLSQDISAIAVQLLHAAGYPVARSGVVVAIGQYQLLIAGVCAGLNSMFSLLAVGTLYLHLMRHRSWLHNGLILASLLPIAFCANIVRVIILVLVTYHFGDAMGQGFTHNFSGMALFVAALVFILLFDSTLLWAIKPRKPA